MTTPDEVRFMESCWADRNQGDHCKVRVPREGDGLCPDHKYLVRHPDDNDRRRVLQKVFERGAA